MQLSGAPNTGFDATAEEEDLLQTSPAGATADDLLSLLADSAQLKTQTKAGWDWYIIHFLVQPLSLLSYT